MKFKKSNYIISSLFLIFVTSCQTTSSINNFPNDASLYIGATATDIEKEQLNTLINGTIETIDSVEFQTNLLNSGNKFKEIYLSHGSESGTNFADASTLSSMMKGQQGYHRVKTPIALVKTSSDYDAISGYIGNRKSSSFSLGRGHIRNWNQASIVHQSCAVNTVAHELSHLISSDKTTFDASTQLIQDRGAATNTKKHAIASYLVGTVAQCTWLQRINHINAEEVNMCIEVFGHRGFNSGRCSQFTNDEKVRIKPGLFEPHVIEPD